MDNTNAAQSVIKQIMEGVDPRQAIDSVIDEKAGYHKEKRIRDGQATTVNVKNTKKKKHVVLTANQKKAIKKAHSAQANRKRAKSLKKGNKMNLYKEDIDFMIEADEDVEDTAIENTEETTEETATTSIVCPSCGAKNVEVFDDPEDEDTTLFICPDCGESFVLSVVDDEEESDDENDTDEEDSNDEVADSDETAENESAEVPECDNAECTDTPECGEAKPECNGAECTEEENECTDDAENSGMFFAPEE